VSARRPLQLKNEDGSDRSCHRQQALRDSCDEIDWVGHVRSPLTEMDRTPLDWTARQLKLKGPFHYRDPHLLRLFALRWHPYRHRKAPYANVSTAAPCHRVSPAPGAHRRRRVYLPDLTAAQVGSEPTRKALPLAFCGRNASASRDSLLLLAYRCCRLDPFALGVCLQLLTTVACAHYG